jgi:hypothetical protein
MPTAIQSLLAGLIDYAGLFPPASLDMPAAVREYASHLASPDRWMLGRFIVPAARLTEFADAAHSLLPRDEASAWRLAALPGPDVAVSVQGIGEFNCRHAAPGAGRAVVDTIEFRAQSAADAAHALTRLPPWLAAYVEVPLGDAMATILDSVAAAGARAKVRTGGVTPDAFPSSPALARFLLACAERRLPFKATAGLHHPLRGTFRLTYDADPPFGTMFGFLNVFLAAAAAQAGAPHTEIVAMLEERSPAAFVLTDDGIGWRAHRFSTADLAALRRDTAVGFGSCSFREPTDDLRTLGWL